MVIGAFRVVNRFFSAVMGAFRNRAILLQAPCPVAAPSHKAFVANHDLMKAL